MHGMRTEHGLSPMQLWIAGLQAHFHSSAALSVPPSFFENDVRNVQKYTCNSAVSVPDNVYITLPIFKSSIYLL